MVGKGSSRTLTQTEHGSTSQTTLIDSKEKSKWPCIRVTFVTWLPMFFVRHYQYYKLQPGPLTLVFSLLLSLLSFLIISLISSEDAGPLVHAAVDHGINLCVIRQQDRVDGKVWVVAGT
jgi:hypothetical protein